jgi:uncharacterized protein (TIGR02284 family)
VVIVPRIGQRRQRRIFRTARPAGEDGSARNWHGRQKQKIMHANEQAQAVHVIHDELADSRKEYESASHRVPEERVKQLLQTISRERVGLEEELAKDLRQHDPSTKVGDGTVSGGLHRALLALRDAVNSTSEVNVLMEMERQESDLLGHYNNVLRGQDLDEFTRATLTRHHAEIERNLAKVHDLRRELERVEH